MIASPRLTLQQQFSSDSDRRLHAAVTEVLANSKYTPLRMLNCHVQEGVVEVSGVVGSFYLKQLATTALLPLSADGRLHNLIEVREQVAIPYAQATA